MTHSEQLLTVSSWKLQQIAENAATIAKNHNSRDERCGAIILTPTA
jgi:hypothetical protein